MRQDLDLLQGSWTVIALEVDGQEMPAAPGSGFALETLMRGDA